MILLPPDSSPAVLGFRWRTHDGRQLAPSEMATQHLVFSLRVIWNNLCPPALVVPGGKRWDLSRLRPDYLRTAVASMLKEAVTRPDLTEEHLQILQGIRNGCHHAAGAGAEAPSPARLLAVLLLFAAGCAYETLDRLHTPERASMSQNHKTNPTK